MKQHSRQIHAYALQDLQQLAGRRPSLESIRRALMRFGYSWKRAKRTRRLLARYGQRIRSVFLPTYSPWLNCIEETWRIVTSPPRH